MKTIKNTLTILMAVLLTQQVLAQAPSISYASGISKLSLGSAYSFSPINAGGTVPATHYGQVAIFVGSPSETAGYTNATGTSAQFSEPQQMTMDASGNLYVADAANNSIREITSTGVVTTFAGDASGAYGYTDATGTSAQFNFPDGLTIDGSGNLYVADYNNNVIRKITSSGVVSTFYDPMGATFGPGGLCFDHSGNLIVAAQDASQIWSINSSGTTATVIAGNSPGYYNATGTSAQFNTPTDVRVDASGNIYVVDFENNAIRKISTSGVVTTFAGSNISGNSPGFANGVGTSAVFNNPTGLVIGPGGAIYIADLYNNDIRRIMPDGTVTLLAGSSAQAPGDADGLGTAAGFNLPDYMYIDGTGTGYIAEFAGDRIKKVTLTGYTLQGTLPAGLSFDGTTGIISGTPTSLVTSGADTVTAWNGSGSSSVVINFRIIVPPPVISYDMSTNILTSGTPYTLDPTNSGGAVPATYYATTTTFAGSSSGISGYTNATGASAKFNQAASTVEDAFGNLYIADGGNNAIRKITPAGVVTTFAGSALGISGNTDATGTAASFNNPQGIAMDNSGNLVVSDYGNNKIRLIDANGVVTTLYNSTSTFGPAGLTVDNSGNVIVAAKSANQIWKITPAAVQSVIAGSGTAGYSNATGTAATFSSPTDVKMDAFSNIFVADYANNAIREISPAGVVTTFAGSAVSGNTGGFLDGVGTAAEFNNPAGLAIIPGGVIYVADLGNNDIRRILPDGTVNLIAGSTSQTAGNTDGTSTGASFNQPSSIFVDNTATGYVTDLAGNNIRQVTLTGYFLVGTLQSGLSFDSSTGEISGTVSGTITPTVATVTAFNSGGFSLIQPLFGPTYIDWKGGTSIDWGTASNWNPVRVPVTTDNVRIGVVAYATGTNYQPTLSATGTTTVNGLAFGTLAPSSAPILTIASGATLSSKTAFTIANSTSVTINGPGGLTLSGNSAINSATQSLTAALNLVITLNSGTSVIAVSNGGLFKLASDQNGSACIAAIPAGSSVTGQVEVDRYVTGNSNSAYRGYRFFTSPVHYATQFNGNNVYSLNYLQTSGTLYGTNLYGNGGGSNGFNVSGNPTVYLFKESQPLCNSSFTCGYFRGVDNILNAPTYYFNNEGSTNYSSGVSTAFNIPVANGLICYFVGGSGTVGTAVTSTIMPATGILNQGAISYVDWNNLSATLSYSTATGDPSGEHLTGNPYPCTIDLNTYSQTNSAAGIYAPNTLTMIQENTHINQSYGDWDVVNHVGTNNAGQYIQTGAAFFIYAKDPSVYGPASLTFNEAAKAPTQQLTGISGTGTIMSVLPTQITNRQYIRVKMDSDTLHNEDVIIWFEKATKLAFDANEDGRYMKGFNTLSLSSLSSDGVQLGINKQPLPANERRIIKLNVDVNDSGNYHFNLNEIVGLSNLYDVLLLDAYKKDSVDLRSGTTYNFKIDKSDTSSFGSNRFSLLIKQNPAYAYSLLDFTASKVQQTARQVQVLWKTQNEENYTGFTVERSVDGGKTFSALGSMTSAAIGQYVYNDNAPVIGLNYYRLKQVDVNNAITYSKVVIIGYNNAADQSNGPKLTIFPNPANSEINLAIVPLTNEPAIYNISINSLSGTTFKQFSLSQTTWQGSVSDLLPGVYYVRVLDSKTQKLVVEGKFVKL